MKYDEGIEPLLTEYAAARILGMSAAWLRRCRWAGTGPEYVRHARAVRYEPAAIRRWIEERRVQTEDGR